MALTLFRETELSRKEICEKCGLTVGGFSAYLQRHHRDLLLEKKKDYLVAGDVDAVKFRESSGQSETSKVKYKDAIAACRSLDYIQYNLSEIARHFHLNPTGLGNQLRAHFPEVLYWRREEQTRRGILNYSQNKQQRTTKEQYEKAVDLLRSTDKTIREVSDLCHVSFSGLRQHVLFYHKDLVEERRLSREKNKGNKIIGKKMGNNNSHQPHPSTVKKYAEAIRLYGSSTLTLKEIATVAKVSYGGFCAHLRMWNRYLMLGRRGVFNDDRKNWADLPPGSYNRLSMIKKYSLAVRDLSQSESNTAEIARQHHLNPETFRDYLKRYEAALAEKNGMTYTSEGKYVLRRSMLKYQRAIKLYRTSSLPLTTIASRLGLNYNSLSGFIRRNYPALVKERQQQQSGEQEAHSDHGGD